MSRLSDDDFVDEPVSRETRKSSGMPAWAIALLVLGGASVMLVPCILIALLLPAVHQAREAVRRTQARNNMKQIGLGMHNFHDTHNHFPPLHVAGDGSDSPPHSWMTDLLPYIDQGRLYQSIDMERTWTNPANKAPFQTAVETYLNPSVPGDRYDANGYALAHLAANSLVVSDQKHLRIGDITDGTSNTFLAGQVDNGFKPCGDPTNHRDPAAGVGGGPQAFGSPHVRVVHILMGDGSIRAISKDIDPQVFQLLGNPADGQQIPEGALDWR